MYGALKQQFNLRSEEFDISANWISDKALIQTHVDLAGVPCGEALELCCGTGQVGSALKARGWDVKGLDIADEMIKISSKKFPVFKAKAEKIPFKSNSLRLAVCRQSFQFLDIERVLFEISRILLPGGVFILSLTIPFSGEDKAWLGKIHKQKQPLLLKFYTQDDLIKAVLGAGFFIEETRNLTVRESINHWMKYAPELSKEARDKIIKMVKSAPDAYKKLHNVKAINKEVFEDWNWVIIRAANLK